ncbi:MAG: hypothetical protein LBR74_05870 [Eubacterium sp.]|jgi:stage III sporulation protein AG|nr:hypothetical protein [Eubacterium sp.]
MDKFKIADILKDDKAVKIIFFIGAGLVLLICLYSFTGSKEKKQVPATDEEYIQTLEAKLADIISEINGAGKIKVMITLEDISGTEDGQSPAVRGAAVVCTGAGNILTKQKIVETVSKVLGISTARVSVVC